MQSFELQKQFGIHNIRKVERPMPSPGPGEVLLEMKAACLNYRDLMVVEGDYNPRQSLPLIPCSDGVGLIKAKGSEVKDFSIGDRVCPTFSQDWPAGAPTLNARRQTLGSPLDGVLRQYACFPATSLVKVPAHLTDEMAATLPCAALTAWSALITHGQIKAGQTVLLQGTGGVSIFALQFAKLAGAKVIMTSSSDEKLQKAKDLGVDLGINYKSEANWGKKALALTEGQGVDHIVEVGGAGTLAQSLKAIKAGGSISLIGILAGASTPLNVLPILMKQVRVQGILVGHKESFLQMNSAIDHHGLRPVVHSTYPVGQIQGALEALRQGRHFGKICLTWAD